MTCGIWRRAVEATPERLLRAFKQTTGLTLQQYRLRARVERARLLLADGRLPIKAVGQDSGFYDQAHLTRAFRAAYGTTPSQYREGASTHTTGRLMHTRLV